MDPRVLYVAGDRILRSRRSTEEDARATELYNNTTKFHALLLSSIEKVERMAVGDINGPVVYYDTRTMTWNCDIWVLTKKKEVEHE